MNQGRMVSVKGWIVVLLCVLLSHVVLAQGVSGPDQMNQCARATFTVTITNESVSQDACFLMVAHTLPNDGFVYVPGSTTITLDETAETFTDDPIGNVWDIDTIRGEAYALPPGETITISYDMETTCAAVSGTDIVTIDFEDCADPGVPLQNVSSTSIEILPGAIVLTKTPSVQDASVGDLVTWTITVENTGLGTVSNVEITDVLGSGLAFDSATDGGASVGQTAVWNESTTPALTSLAVGETVSVQLTAEVIACSGLTNDVDATFGCGPSDVCFDTAENDETATASLNFIVRNPALSFTPPNVTVEYCTDETAGLLQITNSGEGTARNVELCCDVAHLTVDPTRLPPGTTYANQCFSIPDIPGGDTFDLTFYVLHSDVNWCDGPLPSGDNVFQLTYTNDCDIPFVAYPQFSTLSSEPGPSLDVSKTGPASLRLGEIGSYEIGVEYVGSTDCSGGSPGLVTIVDTYPTGFSVADAAGGSVDSGARTITWTMDPNIDPPFSETIQLQAPTDCLYCAQPGGGSDANLVTATGTDCCGCALVGQAEADTTILCEGFGDDISYFGSSMVLDRTTTVRCSSDYAVTVTHTYQFISDAALSDFLLNEFVYFIDGNGNLQYESGSLTVAGATVDTVVDNTPSGQLRIRLADATSVSGETISYEYTLIAQDLDSPSCQATSYPIEAGIELDPGATSIGLCGTMYADPPAPAIVAQPPSMAVSIDGIPVIQEYCATYDVTIILERTSGLAAPYDVRLVLTNNGGSVLDFSQAECGGGSVTPTDGTSCSSPIEAGNTAEWRFADVFSSPDDAAEITFPVTVPCGGPLVDLSVVAYFDDRCHDDSTYDDSCSTAASDEASLSLSADVYVNKSPEILYATTRDVSWSVTVYNTGNGVAYNTWVDDVLGSGLIYDSANSSISAGIGTATESQNLDHEGNSVNGVSWLIDELHPGESRTITVAAELIACDGLTNDVSSAWGCAGESCQAPRADSSAVVVPSGKLVATSYSPTPVPMCSDNSATITMKNAGVTTLYNLIANVTLPDGLIYLGNPEVQVNGGGWSATGEPSVAGQLLAWTSSETPALAETSPNDVIEIRFDYTVYCGFETDDLAFQASYENPCQLTKYSNIGRFTIGLVPAEVTVVVRQVDPEPGEAVDCGGEATWEIDVTNEGSMLIPVTQVTATLDAGLTFVSTSGDSGRSPAVDDGSIAGQTVMWEIKDLGIDETVTLSLTAQSASSAPDCDALSVFINASWGCGDVDGDSATFDAECTTSSPVQTSISATREPPLAASASLSPDAIEGCNASSELTLTIQNTGTVATSANVDVVIDLPSALSYVAGSSETDCGSGTFGAASDPASAGQTLTWYDIAAEGGANDLCASIPPGDSIRLRFDVDVSCYFSTQSIPIEIYYYDCCGNVQHMDTTSVSLTANVPVLTIDKSPPDITLDCYDPLDTATWTITVENTGNGTADWIRLTDTLGSSLVLESSSSSAGAGISMGSNIIGWEVGPLAPSDSFTATVTAHMIQPGDDCSLSPRQDTASVLWGCGALDGDPNTTAEATCDVGTSIVDRANVRVGNLSVGPADIALTFTCSGDGVAPSTGSIELVVRNNGDGDINRDFEITLTETTTGYAISDSFVALGGSLPLAAGSSQTLVFDNVDLGCSDCSYEVVVGLDFLDEVCECREDDNLATLNETITIPDLVVDSASLAVDCEADGQLRIQGPVTIRNDGCGDAVTGTLRYAVTVYDGSGCTGNVLDTFTQSWSGVDIASGGGTEQRTLNIVRSLDLCSVTQLSLSIEVDDNNAVCECSGANNTLCAGTYPFALPDLAIVDVSIDVPDACDPGTVTVTVENTGSGDAPSGITLRITGDASGEVTTPAIDAAASAIVVIPLDSALTCGPKDITVTIDPDNSLCECSSRSNSSGESFTVVDPDLTVADLAAACQPDGSVRITASVSNAGSEASGDVALRLLVDGTPVVTSTIALDAGESVPVDINSGALACGVEHALRLDLDAADEVCECEEGNNAQETTVTCPCPALSVDKVVADIERNGTSIGTAGPVEPGDVVFYRYTVQNVGAGTAFQVDFADTLPAGLVVETDAPGGTGTYSVDSPAASGSLGLTDEATTFSTTIAATISGGGTLTADYAVRVTSGIVQGTDLINVATTTGQRPDGSPIPGENVELGDTDDADVEDPDADDTGITELGTAVPALSVDKTIADISRGGESIGIAGPVEPGDVISYRFVIENVGDGTAYDVEFTDLLPPGVETVAGGSYVVSSPSASGSLDIPTDAASFTTSIDVELGGGETLTADFDARATSDIEQGVNLVNTAEATGVDGFGTQIPDENAAVGDNQDADAEDPDADDTGIAIVAAEEPALSVDKIITDILRQGASIGTTGPVEPGDIVCFRYTIANVGLGTAYAVDFTDTLPTGMVTEIDAPGHAGTYAVTGPAASGSLALTDGASTFTTSMGADIAGGAELTAEYCARVTSAIEQGTDLINVAAATGLDGADTPIPGENADLGDLSDDDAEDPDADDTGITILSTREPALTIDKQVTDVIRDGAHLGVVDPVLYNDVIEYTVTIRNVGQGTAYHVDFDDTIPAGLETEIDTPGTSGSYTISSPSASGSLALPDAASAFSTAIDATLEGSAVLTAVYSVLVTPSAQPSVDLVNTASTYGADGDGSPIPPENAELDDTTDDDAEDPDPDDTGIASVRVGAPALVTRKAVVGINQQGTSASTAIVEPGDIVTYEIAVTNVGSGPAQAVNLFDVLPSGFLYAGNATAAWPSGSSSADPDGIPGPTLEWPLDASLEPGEELVCRFDASVTSDIEPGTTYLNTMTASGEDAAGVPIPPDHYEVVPEDNDPDDTSTVPLLGAVPALVTDKSVADVLRDGRSIGAVGTIQASDVLVYSLRITNVGNGTAYGVDVRDVLPGPLTYVAESTVGSWPFRIGDYTRNPDGGSGPTLVWDTHATLAAGESIDLRFQALVAGAVSPGVDYTNVLYATGLDGAGTPIPQNRAGEIPADDDPDDRDEYTVVAVSGVPALVTTKDVQTVLRNGVPVADNRIEVGDTVRYALTIRNVGEATAHRVDVSDQLPVAFSYVSDSTSATWSSGSWYTDPQGPSSALHWAIEATLRPDEQLTLLFEAQVDGPIYDGSVYVNVMTAAGQDASGLPIPADQSDRIPEDIDLDDSSQASLIGRSAYIQGEGGLVAVPILRKTAEIVSETSCEAWTATVDRLWFQTDLAMYASYELDEFARIDKIARFDSQSLLPTWSATAGEEALRTASSNVLQVNVLSPLGVPLAYGPRIQSLARDSGLSPDAALAARLDVLAARAGLSDESLRGGESLVLLEYEAGEPAFETESDLGLGPGGQWTAQAERLVGSALGMGLLEQATRASLLLQSPEPIDRYLGWVLSEAMVNKLMALDLNLAQQTPQQSRYIPHATRWERETGAYAVEVGESTLFDQLSLVWGLARFLEFSATSSEAWPDSEQSIRQSAVDTAERLLQDALLRIQAAHLDLNGNWTAVSGTQEPVPTEQLGLLLGALRMAREVSADEDRALVDELTNRAGEKLRARQSESGWFIAADSSGDTSRQLLPQAAGILGLLAWDDTATDVDNLEAAIQAFSVLDADLWREGVSAGLYATEVSNSSDTYCYTPLELGVVVGALRELASHAGRNIASICLSRASALIRTVVDEAALQLSNAVHTESAFAYGNGAGDLRGVSSSEEAGLLIPVLQQSLCIVSGPSPETCAGWQVPSHTPWYQTDISMLAGYVLQDQLPSYEDYADANLVAASLHSGLGIPFASQLHLQAVVQEFQSDLGLDVQLQPVSVPYAAGSPALEVSQMPYAWSPGTFDTRITASSLGMTLLRQAQEAIQWVQSPTPSAEETLIARLLTASILENLAVLRQLRVAGPQETVYIPDATQWTPSESSPWSTADDKSTLFGQLSLLWGLSETYRLLSHPASNALIEPQPFVTVDWQATVADLMDGVLQTLESAHLDGDLGVLVDTAGPDASDWSPGSTVTIENLGLACAALEHVCGTFGASTEIGRRAQALLHAEVAFLNDTLYDPRGFYSERWDRATGIASASCPDETLSGQLAALRARLAAANILDSGAAGLADLFFGIQARFWSESLGLYTQMHGDGWCITPLDLALLADTAARILPEMDSGSREIVLQRLASHVDRVLDAVSLQIQESRLAGSEAAMPPQLDAYAPVFDRRVCIAPAVSIVGSTWAQPGDTVRYTITAVNATDVEFTNLVLTDTLPEGVSMLEVEPAANGGDDRIAQWSGDRLAPDSTISWQILARVEEVSIPAESLLNCAELTYENTHGEPQPPREACAEIHVGSAAQGSAAAYQSAPARYVTDEAMRLASAISAMACLDPGEWQGESTAIDVADTNLGVLLQASSLGVSLAYGPLVPAGTTPQLELRGELRTLADQSGLDGLPSMPSLIFLPYEQAIPVLEANEGFPASDSRIIPAAIGWTLARQAQYAQACQPLDGTLATYLKELNHYVIDNQLAWMASQFIETENGFYLPHAIVGTIEASAARYSVQDEGSWLYDQASLLLGLLRVAGASSLGSTTTRSAGQLANDVFDQLARHWRDAEDRFYRTQNGDFDDVPATWSDLGITALALEAAREQLAGQRVIATEILGKLAASALSEGPLVDNEQETNRLLVLAAAVRLSNGQAYARDAAEGWDALRVRMMSPESSRFQLSVQAARGWPNTPRQLASVFELLARLASTGPESKAVLFADANRLLSKAVLGEHVQLIGPTQLWQQHALVACEGLVPVIVHWDGALPNWLEYLP